MLVLDNAMIYNAADSLFHRTAKRIKTNAQPLLDELDAVSAVSQLVPEDTAQSGQIPHDIVGDLEPSLVLLSALSHRDPSDETRDMLGSLFAFELEKPKEPTPPPPSPKKRKDRSHAERKRMWEERQAKAKERAGTVRATRASDAVTKAFVAEAGVQSDVEPSRGSAEPRSRRSARADTESSDVRRQNRPQVGVAGVQAVAVMTDRERREAERALELNTDGVDGQDLFRRFNVGWVLPEGSKRKRAERSEPAKSICEWMSLAVR
jgi:NuA3 HAT complex component NTO1